MYRRGDPVAELLSSTRTLATAEPFSYLGEPVTIGMSHWYENRGETPTSVIQSCTPDSCSAGTVPHPVLGFCRQLGLATAEPFALPWCAGDNRARAIAMKIAVHRPTPSYRRKACPVLRYGAGIQSQALGFQSTLERRGAHTFIPLCGPRKAIVIPNAVRNLRMWPVDISACARTVDPSSLRSSE